MFHNLKTGPHPLARQALGVRGGRGEKEEGLDGGGARTTREAEAGDQEKHGRDRQENGTGDCDSVFGSPE